MKTTFREFEVKAIRLMAAEFLPDALTERICSHVGVSEYEYTGCGYFLSIEEEWIPEENTVLSELSVVGRNGMIQAGFVVFIGENEFTLECHTWGEVDVPSNFRDIKVDIGIIHPNIIDARGE